jgi:hypothetical protein
LRIAPHQPSSFRIGSTAVLAALLTLALVGACGQTIEVGIDDALITGGVAAGGALQVSGTGGANAGGGSVSDAGAPPCVPTDCRSQRYLCGNCIDDDGDGKIDALDPECLGPCDNDELGLSTGLTVGVSAACKQDCYFDGDNGPGNDKCEWSHQCDPLSVAPDYPPSGEARCFYIGDAPAMGLDCTLLGTTQDPACLNDCLPLVPNGCDCFGCCELPGGSGDYRYIGGGRDGQTCNLELLGDESICPRCTPVKGSCFNPCDNCEVCVGRDPDPSCQPGGGCPNGERACDPDAPSCEVGEYCVTGCCVRAPKPT